MSFFWNYWASTSTPPKTPLFSADLKKKLEEYHTHKTAQLRKDLKSPAISKSRDFIAMANTFDISTENGRHDQHKYFVEYIQYISSNHICTNFLIFHEKLFKTVLEMIIRTTNPKNRHHIKRTYPIPQYYQLMYNVGKWNGIDLSEFPESI